VACRFQTQRLAPSARRMTSGLPSTGSCSPSRSAALPARAPRGPFVELLADPLTMLQEHRLDLAQRGPAWRADAQAAVVDGQADGAPAGPAQDVGNRALAQFDAAMRFAGGQACSPGVAGRSSGATASGRGGGRRVAVRREAAHFFLYPGRGQGVDPGRRFLGRVDRRADADGDQAGLDAEGETVPQISPALCATGTTRRRRGPPGARRRACNDRSRRARRGFLRGRSPPSSRRRDGRVPGRRSA
jgi:hypothetical protein